ncbi:MAG: hypothetical protein GX652_04960 [Burkholderiaceae bacterium]|nr:hypothetical protein [Burkholderiaceae bacterium]
MQFQACAYCDHPNPVGTNYCNDCGAALHLKPCRHCGAVAVAQARHCPACQAAFPVRPMIEVDIPWAVARHPHPRGEAGATEQPPATSSPAATHDSNTIDAASPALLATRRLIEKASERAGEHAAPAALVLPPRHDRDLQAPGRSLPRNPDRGDPAARFGPVDAMPVAARTRTAPLAPRAAAQPRRSQSLPVIVLSLIGLVIVVALLFLIDHAGTRDTVREVASPRKILLPQATEASPRAEAAAVPDPAVASTPTEAAAPDATEAVAAPTPTETAAAPDSTEAATKPAPAVAAAQPGPTEAAATPGPAVAATVLSAGSTDAAPPSAQAVAGPLPAMPVASSLAAGGDRLPGSFAASDSPSTPPGTMSTTDSLQSAGTPAQGDSPSPEAAASPARPASAGPDGPVVPAGTTGCRAELQALGLCGGVAQ